MQLTKTFSDTVPARYVVIGADSSTSRPLTVGDLIDSLESYKKRGIDVRVYRLHTVRRFSHGHESN